MLDQNGHKAVNQKCKPSGNLELTVDLNVMSPFEIQFKDQTVLVNTLLKTHFMKSIKKMGQRFY